MLIPPRTLTSWVRIEGAETTWTEGVSTMVRDRPLGAGSGDVTMAYSRLWRTDPDAHGVRLDFRWVYFLRFTGFGGLSDREPPPDGGGFGLRVTDRSRLKDRFIDDFPGGDWSRSMGSVGSQYELRHFNLSVDDFGTYDVLAFDCVARRFELTDLSEVPEPSGRPTMTDFEREKAEYDDRLWRDAMALDRPPPMDLDTLS